MNSVESLAEEAELALSSWTCYIMELGGPYGVEMNFLMKKKEIPSCITVENLLKHSFPSCFCPCHLSPNDLRNTQVSKTAPCDTTNCRAGDAASSCILPLIPPPVPCKSTCDGSTRVTGKQKKE